MDLLILALLGGAAYLYFSAPSTVQPTAAPGTLTPMASTTSPLAPGTTVAPLTSAGASPIQAAGQAAAAAQQAVAVSGPGTMISTSSTTGAGTTMTPTTPAIPSDQQILQANVPPGQGNKASWYTNSTLLAMMASMQMAYAQASCSGFVPAQSLSLQQVAGLTGSAVGAGSSVAAATGVIAASAVPIVGIGIAIGSIIVSLVSKVFSHHAAAVKAEQQTLCAAIPAINNALAVINEALAGGQITPAQARTAYESAYLQYVSMTAPVTKDNSGQCDEGCGLKHTLRALISKQELLIGVAPGGPV
jgi:hypothetical protein